MNSHETTLWLQLEPERNHWGTVIGVRVAKVTKRRPDKPLPGCHVTKVVLDVPDDVFATQAVGVEVPVPSPIRAVS